MTKKVSSAAARPIKTPATVRATAAMAWFVATICLMRAVQLWNDPAEGFAVASYFFGLAGGAAFLGMVLPRRVVSAWRTCRELAAGAGTINVVVLPSLIVASTIAVGHDWWHGGDPQLAEWTLLLATAGAATAVPWAFYHVLGDGRVRSWFCVLDCR